ncbi:MAG TPA: TlpA disulfide reductase family protein [Lacipirellulaceae bacterium]|nr:TlpA disulfide reductase family protein [Lacipirellulaceae bacterium]
MKSRSSLARLLTVLGVAACTLAIAAAMLDRSVAQEAADQAAEEAAAAEADALLEAEIPAAAADIATHIQQLAQLEAQGESQEAQLAYAVRVLTKIRDAAGKMLEGELTDEQLSEAYQYRLMALQALSQLDETKAAEFNAELEKAMNDERPTVALVGWQGFLYAKLGAWAGLEEDAKQAFAKRILDEVTKGDVSATDVNIVAMVAQQLDANDNAFLIKLLEQAMPVLRKAESEDAKAALAEANLEGVLRRLTLMGQPMELEGDLLGGGKLDWKSYQGKVVLVDFSATWCPPCVAEAPNVLAMYKAYKDKGFDVVAISLDRTAEAAE